MHHHEVPRSGPRRTVSSELRLPHPDRAVILGVKDKVRHHPSRPSRLCDTKKSASH